MTPITTMKIKLSLRLWAALRLTALCLLGLWLGATAARAQGNAFIYQGQLNSGGAPVDGASDLTFTLYNAAIGGGTVGTSNVFNDLPISNGVFTVTLDFGAGAFDGTARWLQLAVRPGASTGSYTNLDPRQPILATPYAMRATAAGVAASVTGNVAASQLTGTLPPATIGAGSITGTMLAAGAVGSNQIANGAVTTSALVDGAVTAVKVATTNGWGLAATFANPTPAAYDVFGVSVAALGTDRVVVGASWDDAGGLLDSGAAYLFRTNGTLLATLTNPTPAADDWFGTSVATVGSDRVLIGAPGDSVGATLSGVAYLFRTNGTVLTTFTNPTPAIGDNFGTSLTAVGSDHVLIGSVNAGAGGNDGGKAFLFRTNGTLVTTFDNPTPERWDGFGNSVAALGGDRVLIGAPNDNTGAEYTGAAYLFRTNGTLLTTFTNPTPAGYEYFGFSVAAVGTDRVLVGASAAEGGGKGYLFSTNGQLLTTFTNPASALSGSFGRSVAVLGNNWVLIGAFGGPGAGAAYLFSTNGALLNAFDNPTAEPLDRFGGSVAVLGNNWVLIGAEQDHTPGTNAGAAYLFSLESYTPGLIAEGVRSGAIITASLAAGAVTAEKLDPTIGVWTRSGDDVFRPGGRVGIGTSTPTVPVANATLRVTGGHVVVDNNYGFLSANAANNGLGAGFDTTPDDSLVLYSAGASRVTIATNGNVGIGTNSPAAKLQVVGDVRLGADGNQFAASGQENLRIVRGRVSASGTVLSGTGFTCSAWSAANQRFTLTFDPPFSGTPAITVTAEAETVGQATGASYRNVSVSGAGIVTWISSVATSPIEFSFIAIGPR
jgi:hypothetical protein